MVTWMIASSGCISYAITDSNTNRELLSESERTREVIVDRVRGSSLTVSATESWQQSLLATTTHDGEFEVDMTLSLIGEAPEMVVLSPLLLALDLVALVVTGPAATIEAMMSGDEAQTVTKQRTEPVAGLAANVTSGPWQSDGTTDEHGRTVFELRPAAAQALCNGGSMHYQVSVAGEEPVVGSLSLDDTLRCAALPDSEPPARRFTYWQELATKCTSGDIRDVLASKAERVSPTTLARYKAQHKLPASMPPLQIDQYRTHAEEHASATASGDHAAMSVALRMMGNLLAPHDGARARSVQKQSLAQSATYVASYYQDRSLRSTPSFMVRYCTANLELAQRYKDHRSAAIFSSVLAARAGNVGELVHVDLASSDSTVGRMHDRARREVKRQASLAAYQAEVARMKQKEEAWHYRYLNGRGGGAPRGSAAIRGTSSLANRSSSGPSISEQARAHQEWLQTQKHNAANRNRAFDQFDRRD